MNSSVSTNAIGSRAQIARPTAGDTAYASSVLTETVQVAQPLAETPSGQSALAYRLAAGLLIFNVAVNITSGLVTKEMPRSSIALLIDSVLAIGLLQLRGGARNWVLLWAVLGAILGSTIPLTTGDIFTAILTSIVNLGFCGAVILLLTGQSKAWRLAAALGIFATFALGPFLLIFFLGFLVALFGA